MSTTRICDYCYSEEHNDTPGIKSVLPTLEQNWFCSTNCLHMYKNSGMRSMPKSNQRIKRLKIVERMPRTQIVGM